MITGVTINGVEFQVSDCDGDIVSSYRWSITRYGYIVTYLSENGRTKCKRLQRMLLSAPKGMVVDHIDGDKLNNRRSNLRLATIRQNRLNSKKKLGGLSTSSRFKGVSWDSQKKKWQLHFSFDGKQRRVGFFTDEIEAGRKYNELAIEHYGEYARLNEV